VVHKLIVSVVVMSAPKADESVRKTTTNPMIMFSAAPPSQDLELVDVGNAVAVVEGPSVSGLAEA
jgi:hypothetical protein